MQRSDPFASESLPSLVFTSDEMPGYSRVRRGRGFSYRLPDGALLRSRGERQRIASLAIPPAYESVWICRLANGHLQATGLDARGRKQYVYHPAWRELAADRKFAQLPAFAASLPRIRAAYRRALRADHLSRERVIAGIVLLLDITGYRIGNSRYEKENRSYGLSSLHARHVRIDREGCRLAFRGKSGMAHDTEVTDEALVNLILDLQDLPGQHLFRYEDESGDWHDVGSAEVNAWLREAGGGDYSAKFFRTWKATVLCALALKRVPPPTSRAGERRAVTSAIREVAGELHHTVATCRKYYIHPGILRTYRDGSLQRIMNGRAPHLRKADGTAGLFANERRVYRLIAAQP